MLHKIGWQFNIVPSLLIGILSLHTISVVLECDAIDGSLINKAANHIFSIDQKFVPVLPSGVEMGKRTVYINLLKNQQLLFMYM